jgi:hypothetical protein
LILKIKSELNLKEPTNKKKSGTVYFTTFRKLISSKAASINTILANRVFSYFLISENITNFILATDFILLLLILILFNALFGSYNKSMKALPCVGKTLLQENLRCATYALC